MKRKGFLHIALALFCGVAVAFGGYACDEKKKQEQEAKIFYRISFETNGGKGTDDVYVEENAVFSPAAYRSVRDGYVFDGWFSDEALTQRATDFTPTGEMTLYAKWLGVYCLQFRGEGVEIADVSVTEGKPIFAPLAPIREDYVFEGWYTDETFENAFEFGVMPAAETTLYAKWRELAFVRLRFFLNFPDGNDYSVPTTKKREGSSPDLSGMQEEFKEEAQSIVDELRLGTTTSEVYRFVGWATDEAGENPFDGIVPYSLTEVKIYAIWKRTENYCRIVFSDGENPDAYLVRYLPKGEGIDEATLLDMKEKLRSKSGSSATERTGFYTADGMLYDGAPLSSDMHLTLR